MNTREQLLDALEHLYDNAPGKLADFYWLHEFIIENTEEDKKVPVLQRPVKEENGP